MEIVVVDDCSTDGDVKNLVNTIAKERVKYIRQEENVGSLKNFETCLNIATGFLIHLIHGDDYLLNGYYKKMTELFELYPEAGAACCNFQYVDQQGKLTGYEFREQNTDGLLRGWLIKVAERQRLQYCAVTVRRKVYEELGGFYGVHYGEDWEMWVRIAASFDFAYTPQTLASYRRHMNSISGRYLQNGQNIRDIKWVIEQIQQYIPTHQRNKVKHAALRFYARHTMKMAFSTWYRTRDKTASLYLADQAFTLNNETYLVLRKIWLLTKIRFNL
jgi:glycosyltransferase involved in cell wall biosynthesis